MLHPFLWVAGSGRQGVPFGWLTWSTSGLVEEFTALPGPWGLTWYQDKFWQELVTVAQSTAGASAVYLGVLEQGEEASPRPCESDASSHTTMGWRVGFRAWWRVGFRALGCGFRSSCFF